MPSTGAHIRRPKRERIFARFGFACAYCGYAPIRPWGPRRGLQLDHILPRVMLGYLDNDESNLIPACRECNALKGDRTPEQCAVLWSMDGDTDATVPF